MYNHVKKFLTFLASIRPLDNKTSLLVKNSIRKKYCLICRGTFHISKFLDWPVLVTKISQLVNFQIENKENSLIHRSSFIFNIMPFGLIQAPSLFQRILIFISDCYLLLFPNQFNCFPSNNLSMTKKKETNIYNSIFIWIRDVTKTRFQNKIWTVIRLKPSLTIYPYHKIFEK